MESIKNPIKLYCDNEAAFFFAKNNRRSTASKNIDVKYFSVRDSIKEGDTDVIKIGTLDQLADPLTKALGISSFQKHVQNMGILESFGCDSYGEF